MRELKFRAYFNGQMSHPFTFGETVCWPGGKVRTGSRVGKIMQYTGIKDKNGVEVYEGDVIDRLHDKLGYVVFSGCSFCRRVLTPKGARDYHLSAEDSPLIKIIGNIHENPELLNKK